jgi:uncharacterized protein YggU (UPF0235/DUF167 family)
MGSAASPVRATDGKRALVEVWVVTGSSRPGIDGLHDGRVRVRVAAPPEGGRANREAAAVVAAACGARRARVVAGLAARRKVVEVLGVGPADVRAALRRAGVAA